MAPPSITGSRKIPQVGLTFFQAGYCTHPLGMVLRGESWRSAKFPATFALIQHPTVGNILYDTGYSDRFFEATRPFPFRFYAWTTPVHLKPDESAVAQLRSQQITANNIQHIIISHFHADHIGGLRDFPNARFFCTRSAYEAVKKRRHFRALKAGFLASLLPSDFEHRTTFLTPDHTTPLDPAYAPFKRGLDLLGDGSLLGIPLPGHATGQLGLLLQDQTNQDYFLIADACWLSQAYQNFIMPHSLADLIQANPSQYQTTLQQLNQLHHHNSTLKIVPSHCTNTWQQLPHKPQHAERHHD